MNNYNLYKFQYNNPYYNILIDERVRMIMDRDKLLCNQLPTRLVCKDYTLIATGLFAWKAKGTDPALEIYTDFIRLSFILGEPFIGKYGYSQALLPEY